MEPKDLAKIWDAPDNTKLTPKQISLRLPLLVSAKISALCEMYPRKTKTEIIGDLLATALEQFEKGLESIRGYPVSAPPGHDGLSESAYEDEGSRGIFWHLTGKYLRELEKEAGISEPMKIPLPYVYEDDYFPNH